MNDGSCPMENVLQNTLSRFFSRLVRIVDILAAFLLGFATLLTFVSVIFRYRLNWPIPDNFDFGRLVLGIAIFWGIASASFRSEHIQVDILYEFFGKRMRRVLNIFATIVSALFISGIVWMLAGQTIKMHRSGETTTDLLVPLWPFYAIAWTGVVLTFVIFCVLLWGYLFSGEKE